MISTQPFPFQPSLSWTSMQNRKFFKYTTLPILIADSTSEPSTVFWTFSVTLAAFKALLGDLAFTSVGLYRQILSRAILSSKYTKLHSSSAWETHPPAKSQSERGQSKEDLIELTKNWTWPASSGSTFRRATCWSSCSRLRRERLPRIWNITSTVTSYLIQTSQSLFRLSVQR